MSTLRGSIYLYVQVFPFVLCFKFSVGTRAPNHLFFILSFPWEPQYQIFFRISYNQRNVVREIILICIGFPTCLLFQIFRRVHSQYIPVNSLQDFANFQPFSQIIGEFRELQANNQRNVVRENLKNKKSTLHVTIYLYVLIFQIVFCFKFSSGVPIPNHSFFYYKFCVRVSLENFFRISLAVAIAQL